MEADIVVVAGGASGLAAACSAAEKGASVIVVEKSATVGGAANMGMGLFAVGSSYQKAQKEQLTKDSAFEMFMEFTHYRTDARKTRKYIDMSSDTICWLEKMGVEFLGAYKYFDSSEATWHIVKVPNSNKPTERSASVMFQQMYAYACAHNVKFLFNTRAEDIIVEDNHVIGVAICDKNGVRSIIDCDSAIICTGGFGDNPEMIEKHTGYQWGKNIFSWRIPGLNGDGLQMAWRAGAGKTPIHMELTFTSPDITNQYNTISIVSRNPNLMVNAEGKRFMNEELLKNTPYTGNALSQQPGFCGWMIITDNIIQYYKEHGMDITYLGGVSVTTPDRWEYEVESYYKKMIVDTDGLSALRKNMRDLATCFFEADSPEELAAKAGFDAKSFLDTLHTYNAMDRKIDTQFCKHPDFMHKLEGNRWYAIKFYPSAYGSLGGIKTDENMAVLREDFSAIEGLYAAGMDTNTLYGGTYIFYLPGNTMGYAVNSGRMAGYSAAEFIFSLPEI